MVKNHLKINWRTFKYYLKTHDFIDLIRKIICKVKYIISYRTVRSKVKGYLWFRSLNISFGKKVEVIGFSTKTIVKGNVNLYSNVKIELTSESQLTIGLNFIASYGVIISCRNYISIGDNVMVGEYTSIRDSTHDHNNIGVAIRDNDDIVGTICIGNNVWIGRGCIIFPGTIIEDGVVIGANSVIKGRLQLNSIYAGNPAKLIKKRL